MMSKTCERCASVFSFQAYRIETARFCSRRCRSQWVASLPHAGGRGKPKPSAKGNRYRVGLKPSNAFEAGHQPWNKNLKGIHLSPVSEFKPGPRPDRQAAIGAVRIRVRNGCRRAFVKVQQPNVWRLRAVKVWEDANGPVPNGCVIHHDDRDSLNDALGNLICLTRAAHLAEHRNEHASA